MHKDEAGGAIFAAFPKSFRSLQGDMPLGDFAKKLGMSQALVRTYLEGTRFPDTAALQKISEQFEVSVDWLLGRSTFRVKANERITAQDMGLSEKAAVLLQNAHSGEPSEEGLYPQLVSSIIENKHFTRFIMQIRFYMSRIEEVEAKLKGGADPALLDFYAYRLKAEKFAVTEVLNDLLNDMAPMPEFKKPEK